MNLYIILLFILGASFDFTNATAIESGVEPVIDVSCELEEEGYCPRGYSAFHAFRKVMDSEKYRCYGRPSGNWKSYYCPNHRRAGGPGTCNGTYVQQEFCNNGKTVNLYHSDTACTCGCVGKNFHGKRLNILDLSACGCDDDLDEIIGVDF